eukprot:TRINITY_DN11632_c0_g1_i1.p1 TRINITY_DN11632_c0_g1~~TRINITY_DN11632_c0_g1_i1.p1  ORF type:complete len:214 (+),score=44.08 TRINITY_DN11632_c0_g1_i1:255-896(+)
MIVIWLITLLGIGGWMYFLICQDAIEQADDLTIRKKSKSKPKPDQAPAPLSTAAADPPLVLKQVQQPAPIIVAQRVAPTVPEAPTAAKQKPQKKDRLLASKAIHAGDVSFAPDSIISEASRDEAAAAKREQQRTAKAARKAAKRQQQEVVVIEPRAAVVAEDHGAGVFEQPTLASATSEPDPEYDADVKRAKALEAELERLRVKISHSPMAKQ